jgi:hypothetical protein
MVLTYFYICIRLSEECNSNRKRNQIKQKEVKAAANKDIPDKSVSSSILNELPNNLADDDIA